MFFTSSHEWVDIQGKLAKVGITDFAKSELGKIVYIELPKLGQVINIGEPVCVLESTKAAIDVYAPLSGVIQKINQINLANQEIDWLFEIEISNVNQIELLLSDEQYRALLN